MKEIWKPVKGWEGFYEVSSLGCVKSLPRRGTSGGIVIPSFNNTKGYARLRLYNGKSNTKMVAVHRLVATAFIPNPHNNPEVNHINEIKSDNRVENLEWVSSSDNCKHGTRLARIKAKRSKPVVGYLGKSKLEYSSISDTLKDGFDPRRVSDACRGIIKHHKGYMWKYLEEEST